MFWRIMTVPVVVAAVLVCATPSPASTALLSLAPGYTIQPAGWYPDWNPITEDHDFFVVGIVRAFGAPLDDLHPGSDPAEYTFALFAPGWFTGIWDDFEHNTGGWMAWNWTTGWLRIYRDPGRNATIGNAGSFQDGDLILEASVFLDIWAEACAPSAHVEGSLSFVGGTLFSRISSEGSATGGYPTGTYISARLCSAPQLCAVVWPGQIGCLESEVMLGAPVAAKRATWGSLKALYR
jgi:hypothetical protein